MTRVLLLAGVLVALMTSSARAEPRSYRGPHPIDLQGHWHADNSVHVHDELPVGNEPFAVIDGVMVFLANPTAYGYDADVWTYRDAHPLPPAYGGDCGMSGVHVHPFAPEGHFRRDASGAYVFDGALRGGVQAYVPGRVAPSTPIAPPARAQNTTTVVAMPCQAYVNSNGVLVSVPIAAGYPCGGPPPVHIQTQLQAPAPAAPPVARAAPVAPEAPQPVVRNSTRPPARRAAQ